MRIPCSGWFLVLLLAAGTAQTAEVRLERVPDGGLQPQLIVDGAGSIHLIYLKGDPRSADIYYVHRSATGLDWSRPLRVNSETGSATAIGTIRGPQLAVGRNGRVHVAWNGPHNMKQEGPPAPMLYARLNDAGTAFEPQRNVITAAYGLDGGGSIAADERGRVFVAWHAPDPEGKATGEANRAVFLATSTDEGKTFPPETRISDKGSGACGCCGMRLFWDDQGLHALYRGARTALDRDMFLLTSRNGEAPFASTRLDDWRIGSCPMSSAFLTTGPQGTLAGWESMNQVRFTTVKSGKPGPVQKPVDGTAKKHPVLAANSAGEILSVWTEGTGWQKGGTLAWQLYEANGKPGATKGRADGIPVWGLPAAYARGNDFVVLY
jgi:hypothetical protein